MKTKYGFVALLDALGARTASINQSRLYLSTIDAIETDVKLCLAATLKDEGIDPELFKHLNLRFFGDTILLTYEIKDRAKEYAYFERICFVLANFISNSLNRGLLFRGSLALGEYLDKKAVVLGPAVNDAASWYERLDMIGVLLTPYTAQFIKSHIIHCQKTSDFANDPYLWMDVIVGNFAIHDCVRPESFLINWPYHPGGAPRHRQKAREWFYDVLRRFPIPPGAETKFKNTENFFEQVLSSPHWEDSEPKA